MIPGSYHIELYDGDSYRGPLIVLPDLSPFGGPPDLTAATVAASVRESLHALESYPFTVEPVNLAERRVRLTLTGVQTAALPVDGVWDLQVSQGAFVGTVLSGRVKKIKQVTR